MSSVGSRMLFGEGMEEIRATSAQFFRGQHVLGARAARWWELEAGRIVNITGDGPGYMC